MSLLVPLRLAGLVVVTVPLYLGWVLSRPIAWLIPSADPAFQRLFIGGWGRGCMAVLGVKVKVEGELPRGPYFMVANHLSYLDIPLMLSRLDARFLAKSEIAGWPVLGFLARTTGTLFIDRSRKRDLTRVLPLIQSVLARGTGVIVFPEGTSTAGAVVERFKPSLFEVPVETGVQVRCAALHYDAPRGPEPAWQAVCWWGDAPFAPHFLDFLKQPRTNATITLSPRTLGAADGDGPMDRKALAAAAQATVEEIFTPSMPPEAAAEHFHGANQDTTTPGTSPAPGAPTTPPSPATPSDSPAQQPTSR